MTRLQQARSHAAAIDLHAYRSTTLLKVIAAAAVASALLATPVFAQAAIQEPGAFAQAYPWLDVLNGGAPTPAAKLYTDPAAMQAYVARELGAAQEHHSHR